MTDTTTTDPPTTDVPPPRPGRQLPHPAAIVTWLAIAVILVVVLVTAAGHHSPAASRTARRASGTAVAHQAPAVSAPAPRGTTTTTTTMPTGSPVPYVVDGQPVATRAEATVGGVDFAVTSAHTGHATRDPTYFGSLGLGAQISPSPLPPLSGSGEVWILTGTRGTTMAVGVPPAACGVVWTAGSPGSPAHNVGLPPGDPVVDVVWGLPAPVPNTPTIAPTSGSVRLMFATSCTPAAAAGTYTATSGDPWGFP